MYSFTFIAVVASMFRLSHAWNYSNTTIIPSSGTLNPNASADVSTDVYNQLKLARGYSDRLNTLLAQNNTDLFKFNFNPAVAGATASRGIGGLAVLADSTTAPSLINTGVAMALGFLEPCGELRSESEGRTMADILNLRRQHPSLSCICDP